MFVETITAPLDEWDQLSARLRMLADPPPALVATIAWDSGEGNISAVNLWDSPEAVADFYVSRVSAVVEEAGAPANKPRRHGQPIAVYIRPG